MQPNAEQFRLLCAFEQGDIRCLRDVRQTHCPDQTVRDMAHSLMQFQRHKPPLLKRIADSRQGIRNIEDSCWQLTLDGYIFLMEQKQQVRVMAQRNQCFRTENGNAVYYRIRQLQRGAQGGVQFSLDVRADETEAWQPCVQGNNVGELLRRGRMLAASASAM